jgi:alkaline phosphatase D
MRIILAFFIFVSIAFTQASHELIQSGPMLGYIEYREAMIWVQTKGTADVVIEYNPVDKPESKYLTNMVRTEKATGFTAKLLCDAVVPGYTYDYKIYVNNQEQTFDYPLEFSIPAQWEWRTDPPVFKIMFGSCLFINDKPYDRPGKGYGGDYEIFKPMTEEKPEIMIWLGDNMYTREADWYSRTGFNYRYTHTRSLPEAQQIYSQSINLATWDDHDYGPNNSDRSFRDKDIALSVFSSFWANPSYGLYDDRGIYTRYVYGDIEFILLDNRYHRTPNKTKTEKRTWLGEKQKQWFKDVLSNSEAPYKIVCLGGQFLTTSESGETYSGLAKEERKEIIDYIDDNQIKGVVFLTGDRHFTELSKITTASGIDIWDYTSSPITSGAYSNGCEENNSNRVEGTCFTDRNYGTIEVKGNRNNRQLVLKCIDKNGDEIWQRIIKR